MGLGNSDRVGVAYVELRGDLSVLDKDMKKMRSEVDKSTSLATKGFLRMAGGALAARAAWNFAKEAKDAARDAVETRSKYDTVFSSMVRGANKVADAFARDFGLAGTTARKLLGDTGDLLVGFGFAEDKALALSTEVNSLAQDLASFTNFAGGAEGASRALTKGILGETESVKALGIVLRQNTKEFRDAIRDKMEGEGLTLNQARAEVLLAEAYKQSTKAVGDYARTKDSLANVERRLDERLKETLETLGNKLTPAFLTFNLVLSATLGALLPVKDAVREESVEVNKLARQLANSATSQEERVRIYRELKSINPDIVKGIDTEAISVATLTTNLARFNSELIKRLIIQKKQNEITSVGSDIADETIRLSKLEQEANEALTRTLNDLTVSTEKSSVQRDPERLASITDKINKMNSVLLSNATVEEKIAILQKDKILSRYTNFWVDLTKEIGQSKNSLSEYQSVFDILTNTIEASQKQLGKKPIVPEIPIGDLESILGVFEEMDIILDDAKAVGIIAKIKEELKELNELKPKLLNEKQIAEVNAEIEILENKLKRLRKLGLFTAQFEHVTADEDIKLLEDRIEAAEKLEEDFSPQGLQADFDETGKGFADDMQGALSTSQSIAGLLGTALGKGAEAFTNALQGGLSIVSQILNIVGSFTPGGAIHSIFAQSGGNFSASNNGIRKMAGGGSFTVPTGFGNDTFPMLLSSGEDVTVKNRGQQMDSDKLMNQLITLTEATNLSLADLELSPIIINTFDADSITENIIRPAENKLNKQNIKTFDF